MDLNNKLKNAILIAMSGIGRRPTRQFPYTRPAHRYRKPAKLSSVLNEAFFAPVRLMASSERAELDQNNLMQIWAEIPGGHKWLHYFDTYQSVISHFKNRPIKMLEIGVYKGGSLRMWRNYLPAESIIVGIDIDQSCKQFGLEDKNLFVRIGNQSDETFLRSVTREFGPFDLILDDGSHICSHMIASFNHLFLPALKDGGIYLAEDTHSNFWADYRDTSYSFIDLAKDLVDFMHAHYWLNQSDAFFRQDHPDRVSQVSVPRICSEIGEIRFDDSMVTIYKNTRTTAPVSVHL